MKTSSRDPRFEEVDEMISVLMKFPRNRLAQLTCSFGAAETSTFDIVGSKGSLRMEPAYDFGNPLKFKTTIGDKTKTSHFPKSDQFAPELLYFSDCILKGKPPEAGGVEGLIDVVIINAIQQSASEKRMVPIPDLRKKDRPTLKLLRTCPPIEEPRLVHASKPS